MIEPLEPRIAPATFMVTSILDDLSGGTLREQIASANADPATADTIIFAPGLTGKILIDPAKNAILISGPVTIKGSGVDKLTISGENTTRALFIDDSSPGTLSKVNIQNLSIIGGLGGTNGGAVVSLEPLKMTNVVIANGVVNNEGGGLWVETAGKVSITGCVFTGSVAPYGGGGLFASAASGVTVSKTSFTGNDASNSSGPGGGGALLESGGLIGSVKISDSLFAGNSSDGRAAGLFVNADVNRSVSIKNTTFVANHGQRGGGALFLESGKVAISGSSFSSNESQFGGAIMTATANVSLSATKTLFAGNVATRTGSSGGGALSYRSDGPLNISGCQFIGNFSDSSGGVLQLNTTAAVKISGSLFSGNSATDDGGAIDHDKAALTLEGNTFAGNTAGGKGGAIFANLGGRIDIAGGSFLDNHAAQGGALAIGGAGQDGVNLSLTGVLLQRNAASAGGGALALIDSSAAAMTKTRFLDNEAAAYGGAIDATTAGTVDILNSSFRRNVSEASGGAVFVQNAITAITSSSFFDNRANTTSGVGGAIWVFSGTVPMSKLKVTGNAAYLGGGINVTAGATASLDSASNVTGNFAVTDPNTSGI